MKSSTFTVICYGRKTVYNEADREKVAQEFLEGSIACEGYEAVRYTNIYTDIQLGKKVCKDR